VKLNKGLEPVKLELQIAPLIDVVFLLLIYFLVTASLVKKEGDISFILPASLEGQPPVTLPVEVLIEVDGNGTVLLNGMPFPPEDHLLTELANQVRESRAVAQAQESPFFVNILPSEETLHKRIIEIMDACAAAGVESLTFSKSF
jgi:biopolymer transport protein ExbD